MAPTAAAKTTSGKRPTTPKSRAAASTNSRKPTTAAKTANTRASNATAAAARAGAKAAKANVELVQQYAERAVLVPVGAALAARERVIETVAELVALYSTPHKAETQLKRFERRGATARNRAEREIRQTRARVERELGKRRTNVKRTVDHEIKRTVDRLEKQGDQTTRCVTSQVETAVQSLTDAAAKAQERIS